MLYVLTLWYIANPILLSWSKSSQLNVQFLGDIE